MSPIKDPFERQAALYLMKNEERALIGVGDDGVRRVLGIPSGSAAEMAPDFLSVTKGNKLVLSEAKGGMLGDAVDQLTHAMKRLKALGFENDVSRVEIVVQKGKNLGNNLTVVGGYLYRTAENKSARATIEGFGQMFVAVVQI